MNRKQRRREEFRKRQEQKRVRRRKRKLQMRVYCMSDFLFVLYDLKMCDRESPHVTGYHDHISDSYLNWWEQVVKLSGYGSGEVRAGTRMRIWNEGGLDADPWTYWFVENDLETERPWLTNVGAGSTGKGGRKSARRS